nr:ribonuclease H-like domain-containing protein [Tanacetum cinerariifolium]
KILILVFNTIHQSDGQRNLYKALIEAYESDMIILDTYGDTVMLKRHRDDDADKDQDPSAGSDRGESATAEEPIQTTHDLEEPSHLEFKIGADDQPIAEPSQHPEWFFQQKKPLTPDRDWNKTLPATHSSIQLWISELAKQTDSRSSFNELMDTPVDFSAFLMNRLKKKFPLPVKKVSTAEEKQWHYCSASDETGKKKGSTVTLTTEDMQKRKNDVKARTTLQLSLPDEHQLLFSKYKTAQELWAAILKIFGGNEATKKTKKNLLKQQYGNFKAEGLKTLEQTFNRLQKKSEPNSQNMTFISSAKHSSGNKEVNTASVSTASTNVPTASANIRVVSISQDTACAYIASQSSSSQIKFEDINQIDDGDMKEMDIKWNMALLSMRVDSFWKKTGKKISIQGIDVTWFDKSKVKCFNCHKMGHFARECRAPRSQDRKRRDNYRQGSKVKEQTPKALMAIDGVRWDWNYMANDEENHALIADEETPIEFALMAKTSAESEVFDNSLCSKACKKNSDSLNRKGELETKLTGFQIALKDIDCILESQSLDKNKEGLGYSVVPPPPTQIYSLPKKNMSWTGLPECADDTVTDYSRPAPTIESSPNDAQNRNPSVTETEASPSTISPKPFIKFVKANDSPTKSNTDKVETAKKPPVKYAKQYKKPTKKPSVRGNQRNWNNLKSHQLGPNFVMEKKACFNYGDFNHFAYDYSKRVKKGTSRSQINTHKSFTPRPTVHKPYRPPMRPMRSNMNDARPNRTSFNRLAHSYTKRPFQRTSAVRSQYRAPWVPSVNKNFHPVNRKFSTVSRKLSTINRKFPTATENFPLVAQNFPLLIWERRETLLRPQRVRFGSLVRTQLIKGSSQNYIDDKGYWDSGCSRHMTDNISYLSDYKPFDEGYVSFGQGGCKITGKGTIKTGVVRFGKKGKLAPRFVRPFEIIKKVGLVAYQLDLPEELNVVHDTFHVSNLKKCLVDPTLQVPLDEIRVDAKLNFVEVSVEILEKEFKKLKRSRIAISRWVRLPNIYGFIRSDGYAYPVFVRCLDQIGEVKEE